MIRNIVFDFGKVLVDYDFRDLLSSIFKDPAEREEFRKIFCAPEFCDRCDKGEQSFREIILEYRRRFPEWDTQIQEFHDRHGEVMTGEVPGMRRVLERLRGMGYGLYGLTNWSEAVYPVIEKYDILRMLDGRVISSEQRLIKPDPAIYKFLCSKYSLKAEECLFVDDKQANVDGALAVGMDAVLFRDAGQLLEELQKRIRFEKV